MPAMARVGALDDAGSPPSRSRSRGAPSRAPRAGSPRPCVSAAETKSPGPLRETCRFSTSPKSRFSERDAFITASVITVMRGGADHRRAVLGGRAGGRASGVNDHAAGGRVRAFKRRPVAAYQALARPLRAAERSAASFSARARSSASRSASALSSQGRSSPWPAATRCQAAASTWFLADAAARRNRGARGGSARWRCPAPAARRK